jgi:hypothetical protein
MTPDGWRDAVAYAGAFAVLAAFPRLAYPRRWRTRVSPRRVVAHIAFNTAMGVRAARRRRRTLSARL